MKAVEKDESQKTNSQVNNTTPFSSGPDAFQFRSPKIYLSVGLLLVVTAVARASLAFGVEFIYTSLFWCLLYAVSLSLAFSNALDKISNAWVKKASEVYAGLGIFSFILSLLQGQLVAGLISLITWLIAALAIQLTNKRNFYFLLTSSFILLLFASSETRESQFIVYLVLYAIFAVFCFMHLLEEEYLHKASASLHAGEQRWMPAGALPLSFLLLVGSISFYFVFPQPAPLNIGSSIGDGGENYHDKRWYDAAADELDSDTFFGDSERVGSEADDDLQGEGSQEGAPSSSGDPNGYNGFSDSLDINSQANRNGAGQDGDSEDTSNRIVLYVQADRSLYLRSKVFSHFDGDTWSNPDNSVLKHRLKAGQYRFEEAALDALSETLLAAEDAEAIEYTIEMAVDGGDNIVGSPQVIGLEFAGTVFGEDQYGNLYAPRALNKGVRYVVHSLSRVYQGYPIVKQGQEDLPRHALSHFLALPNQLDSRYGVLAQQVVGDDGDSFLRAKRIEAFLRNEFEYTLDTLFEKQSTGNLETFLFETPRGHCEYFASAMVLMLRALDIPARIATGYSSTNFNPLTGYYEVRRLDGHAWVETYIDGVGWLSFEPTPFYQLPGSSERPSTADALQAYLEELVRISESADPDSFNTQWIKGLTESFVQLKQALGYLLETVGRIFSDLSRYAMTLIVPVMVVLLALYCLRNSLFDLYALYRIRRLGGDANAQSAGEYLDQVVRRCYEELECWQSRRGRGRSQGETLQEFVSRLGALGVDQDQLETIVLNYSNLRYGGIAQTEVTAQAVLSAFSAVCRMSAPWRMK